MTDKKELSQEEKDYAAYVKEREAQHVPNPLFQTDNVDTSGGGGKTINDISPLFDEHRREYLGDITQDTPVEDTVDDGAPERNDEVVDEPVVNEPVTDPAEEGTNPVKSPTRARKAQAKDESDS